MSAQQSSIFVYIIIEYCSFHVFRVQFFPFENDVMGFRIVEIITLGIDQNVIFLFDFQRIDGVCIFRFEFRFFTIHVFVFDLEYFRDLEHFRNISRNLSLVVTL
ncbi:hypothetical protein D3C86_1626190 [compost metagenome]